MRRDDYFIVAAPYTRIVDGRLKAYKIFADFSKLRIRSAQHHCKC
jgi:hypothetical protein